MKLKSKSTKRLTWSTTSCVLVQWASCYYVRSRSTRTQNAYFYVGRAERDEMGERKVFPLSCSKEVHNRKKCILENVVAFSPAGKTRHELSHSIQFTLKWLWNHTIEHLVCLYCPIFNGKEHFSVFLFLLLMVPCAYLITTHDNN